MARVEDLRVVFGGERGRGGFAAVDGVSFNLEAGRITGLVGESGSGKSTTGLAVARLVPITSGRIVLCGSDITALSARAMRPRRADVQMIFQDPHGSLDPRQRISNGLRELRRVHQHRATAVTDVDLLSSVGLAPDILERYPHELSGGQAQRLSIARSLVTSPRVLIADEPTSALDVSVQAQILSVLESLVADDDLAILFISHDLSVVRSLCDTVHVMKTGRIVEQGPVEAVLADPQHDYTHALISAIPGSA